MLIDYKSLSEDALKGIAHQYVCSNLSEVDADLDVEQWTLQVINLVRQGELLVEYSEHNESVYLKKPEDISELEE